MNAPDGLDAIQPGTSSRLPYASHWEGTQLDDLPKPAPLSEPTTNCYIVLGNHLHYSGIGEIVYTLNSFFSQHYKTHVSEALVPNELNVIIDEFSTPTRVNYLRQTRRNYPRTRVILMATEFVTRLTLLGLSFGNTFNFFDTRDDARHLVSVIAYRLGLKNRPPYMSARYDGFVQALPLVDLVLAAHPTIAETMDLLSNNGTGMSGSVMTLYPEISLDRLAQDRRIYDLPAGFVMTGTLTPFRARIASKLVKAYKRAGFDRPIYQHVPFDQSSVPQIKGHEIDLGYDPHDVSGRQNWLGESPVQCYLYNLNPPQRPNWPYSSPMRILRAVLLGQIPVVTRKFSDHAIEEVALVWDGSVESAERMWVEATMGRTELAQRHFAAVCSYNRVAQQKNAAVTAALASIA